MTGYKTNNETVWEFLNSYYQEKGDTPNMKQISNELNMNYRAVVDSIGFLRKKGWIKNKITNKGYVILRPL